MEVKGLGAARVRNLGGDERMRILESEFFRRREKPWDVVSVALEFAFLLETSLLPSLLSLLSSVERGIGHWKEREISEERASLQSLLHRFWYLHESSPLYFLSLCSRYVVSPGWTREKGGERERAIEIERERLIGEEKEKEKGKEEESSAQQTSLPSPSLSPSASPSLSFYSLWFLSPAPPPSVLVAENLRILRKTRKTILRYLGSSQIHLSKFRNIPDLPDAKGALMFLFAKQIQNLQEFARSASQTISSDPDQSIEIPENFEISSVLSECEESRQIEILYERVIWHADRLPFLVERLRQVALSHGVPSIGTRYWSKALLLGVGAFMFFRSYPPSLLSIYIGNAATFAQNFLDANLKERLLDIYRTVRYQEKPVMLGPQSVASSEESLIRMVEEFAKDVNPKLTQKELYELCRSTAVGDLSPIMPTYEEEIKRPIRGIILGNMLRLILIQVQKQKLDAERALVAMDQLLRANDLLLKTVAAVPGLTFLYLFYKFGELFLPIDRTFDNACRGLKQSLISFERIVNALNRMPPLSLEAPLSSSSSSSSLFPSSSSPSLSSPSSTSLSSLSPPLPSSPSSETRILYGEAVSTLFSLHSLSLSLSPSIQLTFLDDLKDISDSMMSPMQLLCSLQRIEKTYDFLSPSKKE